MPRRTGYKVFTEWFTKKQCPATAQVNNTLPGPCSCLLEKGHTMDEHHCCCGLLWEDDE